MKECHDALPTISDKDSTWKPQSGCHPTKRTAKILYDSTLPPDFLATQVLSQHSPPHVRPKPKNLRFQYFNHYLPVLHTSGHTYLLLSSTRPSKARNSMHHFH